MIGEFKDFLVKQGVLGLAIAVVIGGAVSKLVTAIVADLIMPIVGAVTPSGNWRAAVVHIGNVKLAVGDFGGVLLDFLARGGKEGDGVIRMDDLAPWRPADRAGARGHFPAADKVLPLPEAIRRFVPPGSTVALGTCLEQMIPFAATHELIRAKIGDLTLVGPVSDICFDQLIGAGLASRVLAAWVGNVMMGSAYCFRRAAERGRPRPLEVVDFSNFTLALALHAAAIGAPFIPTRSALGTDWVERNPLLRAVENPLGETPTWRSCTRSAPIRTGTRRCGGAWGSPPMPRAPRAR